MGMKIKLLTETAKLPTRGSACAAGYDLYADIREARHIVAIQPHQTVKVGTGIAMKVPDGYFGGIFARSGLATKEGLRPSNCVGVVDSDYTGEVIVALHNDSEHTRLVNTGDRIAQLVIIPVFTPDLDVVDELEETERGAGGFGSTGKN